MQGSEQTPKAPLGNNARPVQNLHHRTVRTNIDFKQSKVRNAIILLKCDLCLEVFFDIQINDRHRCHQFIAACALCSV